MIRAAYAGEPYDIRTTGNTLSLSLLNNTAESIVYRYDEGEEAGNCVEIQIKESTGTNRTANPVQTAPKEESV